MTPEQIAFVADIDRPLTEADRRRMKELVSERKRRKCESLKIYEALPTQDDMHRCRARVRLLIGGNRGGKSVGAAVEFARAVTGSDPYEKFPKADGRAYVVGKTLKHLGDVIYPMLFRAGAFRMIRDENSQEWRVYRPWDKADRDRKEFSRPAPPLIPHRMVKFIAWHSKAEREPSRVDLTNGWEIQFFSAEGRLPRGAQIDLAWPDEEIPSSPDGEWIPELMARCMDRSGRIIWSATPHAGFDQLYDLFLKGEEETEKYKIDPIHTPVPEIANFQFDLADNRFISSADKTWFLTSLSEEEARVRGVGEFTVQSQRVYPEFNPAVHGLAVDWSKPPGDWTNYAYVDPGHSICAVLFITCPPEKERPEGMPIYLAYDELYIPMCNAALFGKRMSEKCEGLAWEAFYLDRHGAPREAGSGRSIWDQYAEAMRENGVQSRLTGHDFLPAADDRRAGITAVHGALVVRQKGGSTLRVATFWDDPTRCKLPNLLFNMRRYRKKKIKGIVVDDPEDRGDTHLCQCVRYACMSEPEWVEYKQEKKHWSDELWDLVVDKGKQREGAAKGAYVFGRGGGL